jgi:hypothetical protein
MNSTRSAQTQSTPSASTAASTTTVTAGSSPCGCGCPDHAPAHSGCCKLTCFERPKFFCGQLLSDADLTLEETYFREKNKLYHRAIDGFGVVCGLQMRCDARCKGHIVIGDGYAIDCCGNDLVICEPQRFDVIGELRKKKWLVEMSRERQKDREDRGDAQHGHEDADDCMVKQCFYIGICYSEEPVDFATPYTTECTAAPGPCQPTRIREGVRFELYDKLPVRPTQLDEIEKRIECCFKLFREGQMHNAMRQLVPRTQELLRAERSADNERVNACHLFEEWRAQFLHQLRICPDEYNCSLEHEVYKLPAPFTHGEQSPTPREAFTSLLELVQKYVFSCLLAQLAFSCPEPPEPCCVLIGSVEIENGRLTRILNYPRWYLPCFANIVHVFIYELLNEAACGKHVPQKPIVNKYAHADKDGCCPRFEVDIDEFMAMFSVDNRAFEKLARTPLDAIKAAYRSLIEGFNFMRPHGIASGLFSDLSLEEAQRLADAFHFRLERLIGQSAGRDLFNALSDHTIHRGSEPLVYEGEERISRAIRMTGAPSFAVGSYTHESISELIERVEKLVELEDRVNECERKLADVRATRQPPEGGGTT